MNCQGAPVTVTIVAGVYFYEPKALVPNISCADAQDRQNFVRLRLFGQ